MTHSKPVRWSAFPALAGLLLSLASCTQGDGGQAKTAPVESRTPTKAQLDKFVAEGPEPSLQALRPLDYWLHYRLMQATGVEEALGGEAQAVAALKALADDGALPVSKALDAMQKYRIDPNKPNPLTV